MAGNELGDGSHGTNCIGEVSTETTTPKQFCGSRDSVWEDIIPELARHAIPTRKIALEWQL
jgi:hypothetical protein